MKRVCVLTGGSSGIGKATALLLSNNGYTVYELSRKGADADGIASPRLNPNLFRVKLILYSFIQKTNHKSPVKSYELVTRFSCFVPHMGR